MTRQRLLLPFTTAAVTLGFVLVAAGPAAAHNYIVSSTPAESETLTALPQAWEITTNEDLLDLGGQGAGFAILVSDAAGQFYGDGCVTVQGPSLSAPAALGSDGDYALVYQLISADGHTLSGEINFTWQSPAGFEPHEGLADAPVCGETESAPGVTAPASSPTEPSSDSASEAVPVLEEPVSEEFLPIVAIAIFLVVVSVIGVVTAAILRGRARNATQQPDARADS